MGIFQFYNLKKPRGFSYKPLYSDERKENLQRKVEKARREVRGEEGLTAEDVKENIKGAFHSSSKHLKKYAGVPNAAEKRRSQNWLLILVAVLLAMVLYLYYK